MMNYAAFNEDDLKLTDFQYEIKHTDVNCFKEKEEVFLKSNPEVSMKVFGISKMFNHVLVLVKNTNGGLDQIHSFPPECLLQYKYRALLKWKQKYSICIN